MTSMRALTIASALLVGLLAAGLPQVHVPAARASGPQQSLPLVPFPRLTRTQLPTDTTFQLHASGTKLLDASGHVFHIAAVNWYGAEEDNFVPGGLDHQSHLAILREIRSLGYNTIRLPLSDELVRDDPVVTNGVAADPALQGLHALDALGIIIQDAARLGLRIILDNHRSEAGWGAESNGLWYNTSAGYPEWVWIDDWRTLATLALQWPNVIGVDLRNEPHTRGHFPWTLGAYANGATWGSGDPTYDPSDPLNTYCEFSSNCHDWRLAAERGGDAVLSVNPHLLVFVEGTELYLNGGTIDENWWGGNLEGVTAYPIRFVLDATDMTAAHLVYSPHEYGPDVFHNPEFGISTSPSTLDAIWQRFWGFLDMPGASNAAPLLLGEFGTCNTSADCTSSTIPGSQGQWFVGLIAYLKAHPDVSWAYWALNGTQAPAAARQAGAKETFGLLNTDWSGVADPSLQNALSSVQ